MLEGFFNPCFICVHLWLNEFVVREAECLFPLAWQLRRSILKFLRARKLGF
jgi:hypothetical protein